MRYAILIYDEGSANPPAQPPSAEESQQMMEAYGRYTQMLHDKGVYLAGEALQPVQTATTIRSRNGKVSTTDGPFAETKEQLGGFYLIEAKDLNDAIQVASRIPSVKTGSIEVRPIMVFS